LKLSSSLLAAVLCAGLLFTGAASPAFADGRGASIARTAEADARAPVAALPGSDAEAAAYERREAESPEVQDFTGGEVVIGVSLGVILLAALIVVIVLLLRD